MKIYTKKLMLLICLPLLFAKFNSEAQDIELNAPFYKHAAANLGGGKSGFWAHTHIYF
jgi:hypothetical protein